MKYCTSCQNNKAKVIRPKTQQPTCLDCFFQQFEAEIHYTIISNQLFQKGEKVAIGASGGKDSTVLAYILNLLNKKYDYGLNLVLVSVDEGITGYRDDSLKTVESNKITYQLPLEIVSYKDIYGWTMDQIVAHMKQLQKVFNNNQKFTGTRNQGNNCTFCGVFRRQALDRGAFKIKANKIVTGHNADDIAETLLMNILRGDFFRLQKCVDIMTGDKSKEKDSDKKEEQSDTNGMFQQLPRVKPFKYTYEKEIVMYAYHKKLEYFSTECIYSPSAYRGYVRELIKNLEKIRPSSVIDIIHSGEQIAIKADVKQPVKMKCQTCGFMASNKLCKACGLLQRLNSEKQKLELQYNTQ